MMLLCSQYEGTYTGISPTSTLTLVPPYPYITYAKKRDRCGIPMLIKGSQRTIMNRGGHAIPRIHRLLAEGELGVSVTTKYVQPANLQVQRPAPPPSDELPEACASCPPMGSSPETPFKKSVPFILPVALPLPMRLIQVTSPRSRPAANPAGSCPAEAASGTEHPLCAQPPKSARWYTAPILVEVAPVADILDTG